MSKQSIHILLSVLLFLSICHAQTGPGGVGTSASNKLWLDGNRGITLVGSNVSNWADQSGNGFNAVPNGAAARPTFVASSANGYPTLDFDGTNDELWINDNAAFDVTAWHIFIVPMVDLAKDYNAWFCKGNDSQENFEMLSYGTNNIHTPIVYTDASRTSPNTADNVVTTTVNVFEYSYSSAVGRDVYRNNNNLYTDNENKTPSNNNFSVYIGNERGTSRFANGDIAEVIMYNARLNSAQRIIVNNYLAAKYNCTLTANDLYDEDNSVNGNFDHEVAGIGRVDATNTQTDSQGSGIVRILNAAGLDNNEYYFWGHDNGVLGSWGTIDYPLGEGVQRRLVRVWRGSETGAITSFDVRFDLTGLGPVTASHLRLLVDTDNDGTFADETVAGGGIISGAALVSGNIYGFTGVTAMNNNLRFTLGTTNAVSTPLPVDLISFEAEKTTANVTLSWATASEKNSHYFDIERSPDGNLFEKISRIKAAGNSKTLVEYRQTDPSPFSGSSFYRLKQVDIDGTENYSKIISVDFYPVRKKELKVFPNPSDGKVKIELTGGNDEKATLIISDLTGRECGVLTVSVGYKNSEIITDTSLQLDPGAYMITAIWGGEFIRQKIIVK